MAFYDGNHTAVWILWIVLTWINDYGSMDVVVVQGFPVRTLSSSALPRTSTTTTKSPFVSLLSSNNESNLSNDEDHDDVIAQEKEQQRQQPSGLMKDWKRFYTSQVEKYYEMQDTFRREREKDEIQMQQVQSKLEITTEQLKAVQQQLRSALQDAKQLRENEKKLRQKHLYELDELQDMLHREQELRTMEAENAAHAFQKLQQQHADQLAVVQDAHDMELGVATEDYNTKLQQKDQQMEQYQHRLNQTQRQWEASIQQVETLQFEKKSMRCLVRDMRTLIRERIRNRIRKLFSKKQ
jgi:hypothetical protein